MTFEFFKNHRKKYSHRKSGTKSNWQEDTSLTICGQINIFFLHRKLSLAQFSDRIYLYANFPISFGLLVVFFHHNKTFVLHYIEKRQHFIVASRLYVFVVHKKTQSHQNMVEKRKNKNNKWKIYLISFWAPG